MSHLRARAWGGNWPICSDAFLSRYSTGWGITDFSRQPNGVGIYLLPSLVVLEKGAFGYVKTTKDLKTCREPEGALPPLFTEDGGLQSEVAAPLRIVSYGRVSVRAAGIYPILFISVVYLAQYPTVLLFYILVLSTDRSFILGPGRRTRTAVSFTTSTDRLQLRPQIFYCRWQKHNARQKS